MPLALLIGIMIICAIAALVAISSIDDWDSSPLVCGIVFVVCVALLIGGVVWMKCAWNQDTAYDEYYSVVTVKMPNGSEINAIMLKNTTDLKNVNSMFGQIIPPNSLVRVYYYNKYSGGINWQNDDTPHYELIVPGHTSYDNGLKRVEKQFSVKGEAK